jgi:hypothetical protein
LEIREEHSAAAHHFFALAKHLMCVHPSVGAESIAIYRGEHLPYRPGWNISAAESGQTRYVFINPGGNMGQTTRIRPQGVPDSEIHVKQREPDFLQSSAFPSFTHARDVLIGDQHVGAMDKTEIQRIYNSIVEVSRTSPYETDEPAEEIAHGMRAELREGLKKASLGLVTFIEPIQHVIEKYLNYTIPGVLARKAVAGYYAVLVDQFPPRDFQNNRRLGRVLSLYTHLRDKTGDLTGERVRYSLHSYYEMTYLATLIGDVAMIVGRSLIDGAPLTQEQRQKVMRIQRNLDEQAAHELAPTFLYPALYCDRGPSESGQRTTSLVVPKFVYPQLDDLSLTEDNDPESVLQAVIEKTAPLTNDFDILSALGNKKILIDEENTAELGKFAFTYMLGRGLG